jgi:NAD(P)H dehydrogenase (quinone)
MIVVTGATGRLGQLVIGGLLQRVPAAQVIAAVRTPGKAASLAARGVTVRAADYNEPEQLGAAFAGADRVLLISSNDPRQSVTQHAAVTEAARQAGAGLLAYTSLWHADTSALLTAVPHRLTEPIIRDSGVPYTFLRNNLYTDHYGPQIMQAARSGIFVGSAGTGRVASATRADLAAAAVAVLTGNGHENKVYELGGDVAWSYAELAAVLSKITGHEIAYQSISPAEHHALLIAAGIPPVAADLFMNTYTAIAEGQLADTPGDLRALIGRPTTTLTDAVFAMLSSWPASV